MCPDGGYTQTLFGQDSLKKLKIAKEVHLVLFSTNLTDCQWNIFFLYSNTAKKHYSMVIDFTSGDWFHMGTMARQIDINLWRFHHHILWVPAYCRIVKKHCQEVPFPCDWWWRFLKCGIQGRDGWGGVMVAGQVYTTKLLYHSWLMRFNKVTPFSFGGWVNSSPRETKSEKSTMQRHDPDIYNTFTYSHAAKDVSEKMRKALNSVSVRRFLWSLFDSQGCLLLQVIITILDMGVVSMLERAFFPQPCVKLSK